MRPVLVVTGTGTGVGKTVVTAAIAALAVAAGRRVAHRAHGDAIQHIVEAIASGYPSGLARSGPIVQRAELSGELTAFLASGEPPVFVGFGSMAGSDPTHHRARARQAEVRAVLATGWGGLSPAELPEGVVAVEQVPHELIFPHVAAVVHHVRRRHYRRCSGHRPAAGGVPFVADQPFWGRRMHVLGVAPAPIGQRALTADGLAAAISQAVTDPAIKARAVEFGALVRANTARPPRSASWKPSLRPAAGADRPTCLRSHRVASRSVANASSTSATRSAERLLITLGV